jgi:hypothetical protein
MLRERRGCDAPSDDLSLPFDPALRRCPWAEFPSELFDLIAQYRSWSALGLLPYGGESIGDQPQPLIEAFTVLARVEQTQRVEGDILLGDRLLAGLMEAMKRGA